MKGVNAMQIREVTPTGYQSVVHATDSDSGLSAYIAIHDTTLGPALGGTRMWPYHSKQDALTDVLRLAEGMTYKASSAGLNLGGGKAVIIGDFRRKSDSLLTSYAKFVDSLRGKYITAEDVGTCQADMDVISRHTKHVVGISGGSGDPSPATAYGVYLGIKAAALETLGSEDLAGKVIAVQGVGNVGYYLCRLLHREGAKLIVSDIDKQKIQLAQKEFNAAATIPQELIRSKCHIFAPCALGSVINDETISALSCQIIAGSANNVLATEQHGAQLHKQGILYVPDYVINAGGLINVAEELNGYNAKAAKAKISQIPNTIKKIFSLSRIKNIPTSTAARQVAEVRLRAAKDLF